MCTKLDHNGREWGDEMKVKREREREGKEYRERQTNQIDPKESMARGGREVRHLESKGEGTLNTYITS